MKKDRPDSLEAAMGYQASGLQSFLQCWRAAPKQPFIFPEGHMQMYNL